MPGSAREKTTTMRKAGAAATVAGTVFAVTAAAASAISVTGPFTPSAATGPARLCDTGAISVDEDLSAYPWVNGFTVSTVNDTRSSAQPDCADATIWIKVVYTPTGGSPVSIYAGTPANNDYRNGLYFGVDSSAGNFYDTPGGATHADAFSLQEASITSIKVIVMVGTPAAF